MTRWVGHRLVTSSYDGSVRLLDFEKGMFELVYSDESDFSALDTTADGHTLLIGDNFGDLLQVDTRAPADKAKPLNLHAKKVNTLQVGLDLPSLYSTSVILFLDMFVNIYPCLTLFSLSNYSF